MRAAPGFGPRGAQLTVALLPPGTDVAARDTLVRLRLAPLPPKALQWRTREAAVAVQQGGELWSLAEEAHWSDFWAEQVPRLRAAGWQVVVDPGFAHFSLPVQRWKLQLDGSRTLDALGTPEQPLARLRGAHDQGSWRMSLGVEVDGETLDLAPLLAGLLARDRRWLHADRLLEIDDAEIVVLRAPGGRRIEAPAAPLKAIVGAMLDLLVDARSPTGPIPLSTWDAERAEALREELAASMADRAGAVGPLGAWQLQGDAGLHTLVQRLRTAGTPPPVDPPPGLGLTLRPYQLQGLAWLQTLRAQGLAGILADDMGLGKTAQVLAHVLAEHAAGRLDRPALVVLPTSLIANWQAEAARVAPGLRVLVLHGARRDFAAIARHDLVLTTYPLLWRDSRELGAQPWHLLVLDEAQMAKNAGSRAARALRRLDARHRLCVTGTPLENHLGELWTHFDLLMPGFLGDSRTFARLWRRPIEDNGETQRAALLARRVRPFILRRRKHEVAPELPPLTEVLRRVPLQGTQRALYESVRAVVDEQVRRTLDKQGFRNAQIAVLDALLKLRQVCCDPRLVTGPQVGRPESAKLELLLQMLPALVADGRRVLVFSQFSTLLGLVAQALQQIALPHLLFTGDTPPAQRGETVRRFQAREVPVLLLSLKAGGVGLNLTAADTVVHLDPWWNPAVEDQATARAHRIGQDQPVLVYRIVAAGSIEERMLALQARKAALAAGVLGSDTAGDSATKFDEADLRGLLAPLEDA